ncbi:MAG: dipeptidase [Acidimicrobiia bacterium]|nr:dipeptidase [Acidimicrobiia bacterium]NNF63911.1 dipeptidase [Acidimicrobiia bacterium]
MHEDLANAIAEHFPTIRADLEHLVRIPSVSASGFDPQHVRASAEATRELLEKVGATDVQLLELDGAHPAVFGQVDGPEGSPTVLLYAHHDVQPPGDPDKWTTEPFHPTELEGRLYGRGTADDKSGIAIHTGVLRAFEGKPPVTVKVFVEGEEEIGSLHLDAFLEAHGDLLAADVIVIADSGNWRVGQPAFTTSLRGLVDCVVEVRTLRNGVHSGQFGGVLPDALTSLARVLASLHDESGEVAIEGLVSGEADPLDLTEAELRSDAQALASVELIGSGALTTRLWRKPACSVLAIDAPSVAEAINQLVPSARAKVSLRLAPGDDPDRAMTLLTDHLVAHAPWGVEITVTPGAGGEPFALAAGGAGYDAFQAGFEAAWETSTVEIGAGGSIPFVAAFSERFPDAEILLTGVADPTSAAHGPNESLDLDELRRGALAEAIALRVLAG